MSIETINEQLLRAVGVGIALFDTTDLEMRFCNEIFRSWFDGAQPRARLADLFPRLDIEAMRSGITGAGRFASELKVQKGRRTLVIAQTFTPVDMDDRRMLVLESQNVTRIRELELMIESYSSMVERNTREIQREKEQVEKLLLNIMPRAAYEEYRNFGVVAPQRFDSVSVLILNFPGFNDTIRHLAPATFIGELNELYSAFDRIGEQFGCERIKTTGGTYLCIAGMHDPTIDHGLAVANAAVRFVRYLTRRNDNAETRWYCRIGIASGSVLGSVVGVQKYVYDVFGDALEDAISTRAHAGEMEALVSADLASRLQGGPALVAPKSESAAQAGMRALAQRT